VRIAEIQSFPVRIARDPGTATGTAGLPNQLAGTGDYRWSKDYPVLYSVHVETALVRVKLEDGSHGWGEAQAPLAPEVACTIIDRLLRPALLGEQFDGSIGGIRRLWDRMYSTMRVRGQTGGFMLDAISGVDLALWDLAGKMAGKPVAALIGADARKKVPAYLSGLAGATTEERVRYAREYHGQGFRECKIYYESDWEGLLRRIDELSGDFRVAVDALWHLHPERAVEQARQLDERDALWLECPLMPEQTEAHVSLARSIRTPLALGESYRTCHELEPFFRARVMKYVQPDLGRSGITESLRIAARAAELEMEIVPHVSIAFGPQIAAAVHLAAALDNCAMCEYNPRVLEVANRFMRESIVMEGAAYRVPSCPGLGAEIDVDALPVSR
jgi:D-galactarolactone cycloisomerase